MVDYTADMQHSHNSHRNMLWAGSAEASTQTSPSRENLLDAENNNINNSTISCCGMQETDPARHKLLHASQRFVPISTLQPFLVKVSK